MTDQCTLFYGLDPVRITNRITSAVKNYYPHVLDWFSRIDILMFCDFIDRWPTLQSLYKVRTTTRERFFNRHNVRRQPVIDERIDSIRSAQSLTDDPGVIAANSLVVQTLVAQLRVALNNVKLVDEHIAALCKTHRDHQIFASFPGAGAVFSARLLAAFRDNYDRYTDASQMHTYSGVAPVLERSGN